jgi:hypothetical protein
VLLFKAAHLTVDGIRFILELLIAGTVHRNPPIVKILCVCDKAVEMGTRALEYCAELSWQGCDGVRGSNRLGIDGDEVWQVVDAIAVGVGIHEAIFSLFDPFCGAPKPIANRDFEVRIIGVKLKVLGGSFKHVLISHEAVSKSLYLF